MFRKQAKKIVAKVTSNNFQTLNTVELNKSRLLDNFSIFQNLQPTFSIIPVLKGNAYGHGLTQVAEILNEANCDFLAVDGYFEAAKIRDVTNHNILVLGYILPENVKLLDTKKCSFVVQDVELLHALGSLKRTVRIHIELNTGMNRLGLQISEIEPYLDVLKKYKSLKLEGVMTHLADADNATSDEFTDKQTRVFDDWVAKIFSAGFEPKYIHIAQTAGSTKAQSKYANSLRVGIGLYGINPLSPNDNHYNELRLLKPILELKSTVIKIVKLGNGDKVSYNGIFTAKHDMDIGVLPLGYYEGIPRELSNTGFVTFGNKSLPIVGRVCMNHTMIDLKDTKVVIGSKVTVISKDQSQPNSVEKISTSNELFSYSLLTGISESIRRVVI